jgi:DHA2 family multidrug resistance protein
MLASHTGISNPLFRNSAASLAAQLRHAGIDRPETQAYGRMYRSMQNQASTLSYIDTFWLLGIATGIMFLLSFLLKKNNPRRAAASALAH